MLQQSFGLLTLEADFLARHDWSSQHSSCLFPVRVRSDVDTYIVFFDYWQLKNGLDPVSCRLKIFTPAGESVLEHALQVVDPHNEISLKALLGSDTFDGMVEVEFCSEQNLKFSFPGISAFYRSGRNFSQVHAGGRMRSRHEGPGRGISTETNWTCVYDGDVIPFFHVFSGRENGLGPVTVRLLGMQAETLAERVVDFDLQRPYASKLVLLDQLFGPDLLRAQAFFVAVDLPDHECFPRMVVGNFHTSLDFLEATHSFYWVGNDDFLQSSDAVSLPSFLPVMNLPELDLEMVFYPTNTPAEVTARIRAAMPDGVLGDTGRTLRFKTGGDGAQVWRLRADEGVSLMSLDFCEGAIPARMNAGFRYSVKGAGGRFSTDIATGVHASVYPEKRSHWGHGIVGDGYDTVLMIRNISHRDCDRASAKASLALYDSTGMPAETEFLIAPESARFIRFSELLEPSQDTFLSWFLRSENPDLETYWISYAADGRICGDHGF